MTVNGAGSRILRAKDEARIDLDRPDALLIPDLQQRISDLTRALQAMVVAAEDRSRANREEALARARRVLALSPPPTT